MDLILIFAGAAIGALFIWGIVRLVNGKEKIDWRLWSASALAWLIWLVVYWAWVAWRADAPDRKDASFPFLVAPAWFFSATIIVGTEFCRFRARPMGRGALFLWVVLLSVFQMAALFVIAAITGIYVHFGAGGKS